VADGGWAKLAQSPTGLPRRVGAWTEVAEIKAPPFRTEREMDRTPAGR